jgi:DnaK suppressor protein
VRLKNAEKLMASLAGSPEKNGSGSKRSGIELPEGYRPSADEEFMGPLQLEYFRRRLLDWKKQILAEAEGTLATLQSEPLREPDLNDRASSETDWSIELRTRDRQRKLISKIDSALRRIDDGEYGYCEVTGEPISLGRLEARPIATMTVEAQERHERQEKVSRDD